MIVFMSLLFDCDCICRPPTGAPGREHRVDLEHLLRDSRMSDPWTYLANGEPAWLRGVHRHLPAFLLGEKEYAFSVAEEPDGSQAHEQADLNHLRADAWLRHLFVRVTQLDPQNGDRTVRLHRLGRHNRRCKLSCCISGRRSARCQGSAKR